MNKKIIALLMAAAITTGMGGYGTMAYFTSQENVAEGINITMGALDVSAEWDQRFDNWIAVSANGEAKVEGGNFTNVKPGDYFYKDIIVSNDGTLKADTVITLLDGFEEEGITTSMSVSDDQGNEIQLANANRADIRAMEVNAVYTVRVNIEVSDKLTNDAAQKVFNNVNAEDFIKVTSHQTIN